MCGRFALDASEDQIINEFGIHQTYLSPKSNYNIAPTQEIPVVIQEEGRLLLDSRRWGLVPFWVKDLKMTSPMINARAETLLEKPSFKHAFKKRRCLVLATGFYEWKKEGKQKQPMFIHLKGHPVFAFAGLWEEWKSESLPILRTCTIVTVEPNSMMTAIHDRMPAILSSESRTRWLDPKSDPQMLLSFLRPYPSEQMEAWPVSTKVNHVAFNHPHCMAPVETLI